MERRNEYVNSFYNSAGRQNELEFLLAFFENAAKDGVKLREQLSGFVNESAKELAYELLK